MSNDKTPAAEKAAPKKPTNYVVLEVQSDGTYSKLATVAAITSEQAKRNAASALSLNEGDAVTLVAVPEKSFQPKTFSVEVPKPRLVAA